MALKHSPLCSRNDGREIYFTAKDGEAKFRFVVAREVLDDVCGDMATEKTRKAWVKTNLTNILDVRLGAATAPFDRVHVEEMH